MIKKGYGAHRPSTHLDGSSRHQTLWWWRQSNCMGPTPACMLQIIVQCAPWGNTLRPQNHRWGEGRHSTCLSNDIACHLHPSTLAQCGEVAVAVKRHIAADEWLYEELGGGGDGEMCLPWLLGEMLLWDDWPSVLRERARMVG